MAPENDLPDNEDVKKKAMARLLVAGVVTAAALGGLWWLDQGKNAPSGKPASTPQPTPIRPAQAPEPAPPQAVPPAEPAGQPQEEHPVEATAPTEAPPPPKVSNTPRLAPQPVAPPTEARPAPTVTPREIPASASKPPLIPPTVDTGSFVVQLGVFASPARAEELVRQLKSKGIRATTETRVHVGPFLNRQEAEKAKAEMTRLGIGGIVTTAAPTK